MKNKWEEKKNDKKEYSNNFGKTDYNIPMFGYKSSLLIVGVETIVVLLIVLLTNILSLDFRFWLTLLSPLSLALTISFSQNFIETKRGFGKNFYITFVIIEFIFVTIFYLAMYKNITF